MDAFNYEQAFRACAGVCQNKRVLVAMTGLTREDCIGDAVSHCWELWKRGKYDASKSAFHVWVGRKAACWLVDAVRSERGKSGNAGRAGKENVVKERIRLENSGKPEIAINSKIPDGPRMSIRAKAVRHRGGRLGWDFRLMGRAILQRKVEGCSWTALRDRLKNDADFARTMGFREVPGIATLWRLKRRTERFAFGRARG